ncbi:MAG: hypothetical protein V4724_41005 [Pseudomonadota bacterium]
MSYNLGMNQLTLVLPYSLTPPELTQDLVRALPAPALAMLLSRHKHRSIDNADGDARLLAHEAWLSRLFGATQADQAPFAAAVMRGFGMAMPDGHWFLVHPVHVQLARTHLTLADPRNLRLDDADARALFDTIQPYVEELGKSLLYGDAGTWFLRADDWKQLRTASPDAAIAENLSDWMPEGDAKRAFRQLQNEVQMLWHEHPVNEARQARGLSPVNSFWLWGGADADMPSAATPLGISGSPPWLNALADPSLCAPQLEALLARTGDATVLLGELVPFGIGGDWSPWLMQMQQFERDWFAPLLAALRDGRLARLRLVLGSRLQIVDTTITKGALRKFWRKPTLTHLSP